MPTKTPPGRSGRGRPRKSVNVPLAGENLVTVEDIFGRKHHVPRAWLPGTPPKGAVVFDFTGPQAERLTIGLAIGVGKEAERSRGTLRLTEGDFRRLLRAKVALEEAARPRRVKGGQKRAAGRGAETQGRNGDMRTDFIVAVQHDEMTAAEAVDAVAKKYGLTLAHTRRIIKPRRLMNDLRGSSATAQIVRNKRTRRR